MAITPYPVNIHKIVDGEPVSAGTINRPLSNLEARTQALLEQFRGALRGRALISEDQPLDALTKVGQAVYRDNSGKFLQALASISPVGEAESVVGLDASAYQWGVVGYKHSSTLGDVILFGEFEITESDLKAATASGDAETGLLFLAGVTTQEGKLTSQQPPIGLPVCSVAGPTGTNAEGEDLYTMFVNPGWRNPLEDHIHYHIRLSNVLAGSDELGWQSVTHPNAPVNAVFEYGIDADPELEALWPPIPIGAVHYDIDGVAADLINSPKVLINDHGIFWMDNGTAPDQHTTHDFYFTRMTFKTAQALVQSLQAADDTVVITDLDGNAATTGRLKIRLNLTLDDDGDDSEVVTAFKEITGSTTLKAGPVVTKLIAGTGIELASSNTVGGAKFGAVTVSASTEFERYGPVEFVALNNVDLEKTQDLHHLSMYAGVDGEFIGRLRIPSHLTGTFDLKLEFYVWGFANNDDLPDLDLDYFKIVPSISPTALSPSYNTWPGGIPLSGAGPVALGEAVLFTTQPISVVPGELVFFKVTRNSADGYPGKIGLVDQRWTIETAIIP